MIRYEFSHEGTLLFDEPLSRHTTFRTGGNADALLMCACAQDVEHALDFARSHGVPFYILGNGSNTLAPDEGFCGLVIKLGRSFSRVSVDGRSVCAQAGALLPQISNAALAASLSGLEFCCGIPGSVGGALVMNAGAYGGEMKQVVTGALLLHDGNVRRVDAQALGLSYRHSALMDGKDIVLEVYFQLSDGDKGQIKSRMDELRAAREQKQPVELPSAGSAFKRPQGYFAAALIDECALKGLSVGGAQVSEKHAGFIVNTGGATTGDVRALIALVQERVFARTGVMLEPEIRIMSQR